MNEELINKIIDLAKLYHVTKLIQFGSSIESFETCIDVDFACDGIYDKNFFKFGASLEKLLKKQIDLIPLKPTGPFIEHIIKQGRTLYDESTDNRD